MAGVLFPRLPASNLTAANDTAQQKRDATNPWSSNPPTSPPTSTTATGRWDSGTWWVYREVDEEWEELRVVVTVTTATEIANGVTAHASGTAPLGESYG
jgi:hypothetical protein